MLGDALTLVGRAVNGAWAVIERLGRAIPGWLEIMVVLFFVSLVVSLIIMPIRGGNPITGASSDEVRVTDTRTFNHRTGKWNHVTYYSKTERRKK